MVFFPRLATLCLLVAAPSVGIAAEEKLSQLNGVQVETQDEHVLVLIEGTLAPNFTSFTMQSPFRVVVDWAGSGLPEGTSDRAYERGLVRRVKTRQFNSEAEKISRVVVELAQSTTYRVEATGTTVRLVLDAVPDALPPPEPVPVPVVDDVAPEPAVAPELLVQGPLTEPDVAVPSAPPMLPKAAPVKVAVAPKPVVPVKAVAQAPEPVGPPVVDAEPAVAVVVDLPAAPAPVVVAVAPMPKPAVEPEPTIEPEARVAPKAAPIEVEPVTAVAVVDPEPANEPVVAVQAVPTIEPEPRRSLPVPAPVVVAVEPTPAVPVVEATPEVTPEPQIAQAAPIKEAQPAATPAEPVRMATFKPTVPAPTPTPAKPVVEPVQAKVQTPAFAKTQRTQARTQRLAAAMPAPKKGKTWSPPGVVQSQRRRSLKVVQVAAPQDDLQPERSNPIPNPGAEDVDPGPRVMKYIGFRQLAQTSRVFVRMDGKARFRQFREGDLLVIELSDTSVPIKNNTRALDTSYFNTPVLSVQAVPIGDNTRIEIKMREQGAFRIKRIGTTIAIDFSRAP